MSSFEAKVNLEGGSRDKVSPLKKELRLKGKLISKNKHMERKIKFKTMKDFFSLFGIFH